MTDHTFRLVPADAPADTPSRDFVVPSTGGHAVVAQSVFQGTCYPIVLKPEGVQTIVDIGANCGAASAWFRLHYPSAYIRAYEPHPAAFAYLARNAAAFDIDARPFGLYLYPKTMLLRDGVDECGTVVASVCPHPTNTPFGHEIALRGVTDEIGDLHIDILKIDTEGCELPILRGVRHWEPRAIYLETHSDEDRREVDKMLADTHILFASRTFMPHKSEHTYVRRSLLPPEAEAQAFRLPELRA